MDKKNLRISIGQYTGSIDTVINKYRQPILEDYRMCWDLDKLPKEFDWNIVKLFVGGRLDHMLYMFLYASLLPPNSTVVEIGTDKGGTAIAMGMAVRNKGTKIYTIDPTLLSDEERQKRLNEESVASYVKYNKVYLSHHPHCNLDTVMQSIKDAKLENTIVPIPGMSKEVFDKWDKGEIDMLFVDGEHTYDFVKIDCQWMKYVKQKGFAVFDDWIEPVSRAVEEYVLQHNEWNSVTYSTSQESPDKYWKTVFFKE